MEDDIALICLQVPQIAPGKRNVGWGVGRGGVVLVCVYVN